MDDVMRWCRRCATHDGKPFRRRTSPVTHRLAERFDGTVRAWCGFRADITDVVWVHNPRPFTSCAAPPLVRPEPEPTIRATP